jgi:YHS domain-containing protein
MYRLILILGLLVVLYILLRQAVRGFKNRNLDERGMSVDQDQMVQDPVCHTFVPRRIAVVEKIGGQTYCFCSRQCAVTFHNQQAGQQPE